MAKKIPPKEKPAEEVALLSKKLEILMVEYKTALDDDMQLSQLKGIFTELKDLKILILDLSRSQ